MAKATKEKIYTPSTKGFTRAVKARLHTEEMALKYNPEINDAISNSIIYTPSSIIEPYQQNSNALPPDITIQLMNLDSLCAAISTQLDFDDNRKVAILNFASYKHPGGNFINGSMAQEEALCHESFLYNVLREFEFQYYAVNEAHLNNCLYEDRALYTPNVTFIHDTNKYTFDVITCAAPNYGAAAKNGVSPLENEAALMKRVEFLYKIAIRQNVDALIVGAWGCGVFKQEPTTVAETFLSQIPTVFHSHSIRIVFAVPAYTSAKNFDAFRRVLQ